MNQNNEKKTQNEVIKRKGEQMLGLETTIKNKEWVAKKTNCDFKRFCC